MDAEVYVSDFVFSLAHEARRTSLVTALRQQQGALTLTRLDELLRSRKYGDDGPHNRSSPNSPSTACWSAEARRQAHATASLRDHALALDESS